MKKALKWLVVAALLYWLFSGIDIHRLQESLAKLKPTGILYTFLAVFFSDLVISYRWYYLSRFRHSFISSVEANMLAFFLNIFAPAKLGDLSKIYYMKKKDGHDAKHSASLFLIERLFDVLVLGSMILFCALAIVPGYGALAGAFTILALVGGFFYLLFHYHLFVKFIKKIPFPKARALAFLLLKKIRSNLTRQRLLILFLLTLAVWGSYYLNNYIFFLTATDLDLSLYQIFIASTLAFAVSAIPITPGGIGTFQAAFVLSLGWYGVSKEDALALSIALQVLYILPATLYSLYLLLSKDFLWSDHAAT